MRAVIMKNNPLYPVLFGIVIALAPVLIVTAAQDALASAYAGQTSGSTRISDVDVAEAAAAENTSMAPGANETGTGNMTGAESQNAQSGSISGLTSHAEGEGITNSDTDSQSDHDSKMNSIRNLRS
jgi:hypothetical protein